MYLPKIRLDHWQGESCVTAVPNWSVSSQIRDRPESIRSIDPRRNQYNRRIQQLRVTEGLRKETPISLPGRFYSPPRNLLLTAEHHKIPFRIKLHYLCLQKQLGLKLSPTDMTQYACNSKSYLLLYMHGGRRDSFMSLFSLSTMQNPSEFCLSPAKLTAFVFFWTKQWR